MPIYAYKCTACGHTQDVLQKMSDDPLTVCPACGAAAYEKQVTAAGFQLKGSGWYVTDFREGNKKKDDKKEGTATAPESKSAENAASPASSAAENTSSTSSTTASPAPAASPAPSSSPSPSSPSSSPSPSPPSSGS